MHKAIRIVASSFGAFAGFGGIEHGIFEIMQGNVAPGGVTISSIGPPCVPELAWNACEPAITLLPNFLATGILAVVPRLALRARGTGVSDFSGLFVLLPQPVCQCTAAKR